MNRDKVKSLKERYPAGTRIMLDYMDDPYHPIEKGMTGTVTDIDDMGTIHMKWDNGSSLGLCPDTDRFHVVGKDGE